MAAKGLKESPFDDSHLVDNIKYGDADLSSKRRKLNATIEQDELEEGEESDKNNTYLKFETNVNARSYLHSSFIEQKTTATEFANIKKNTLKFSDFSESSAKHKLTITDKPSVSSKGFDNTFKLLQNQIRLNSEKTLDLLKIINADETCRSLTLKTQNTLIAKDEEPPTCLELQLESFERIQNYVNAIIKDTKNVENKLLPLLELLYRFLAKDLPEDAAVNDIVYHRNEDHFNKNLIYYVGKNTNGSNCLKIVHNMLNTDEEVLYRHNY